MEKDPREVAPFRAGVPEPFGLGLGADQLDGPNLQKIR